MTWGCNVCGSTDLIEGTPRGSALCEAHREAGHHVVSMQTGAMVCPCGWQILGQYSSEDRDRFVKLHWEAVCAGAPIAEGTS
ncbi:MAG: hypothetical protein ABL914_10935 [Novosphingobium sp.]|uniref:hypothetical protein n=1 Tax=Novosphingobium sp. TaxID=1874826 RepID=UPI0032B8D0E6